MTKEKNYLPSSIKEIKTKYGSMLVANFKMDELKNRIKLPSSVARSSTSLGPPTFEKK